MKFHKLPHFTRDVTTALTPSAFRGLSPETWREEEAAEIQDTSNRERQKKKFSSMLIVS